jgi:hypothetical protein
MPASRLLDVPSVAPTVAGLPAAADYDSLNAVGICFVDQGAADLVHTVPANEAER